MTNFDRRLYGEVAVWVGNPDRVAHISGGEVDWRSCIVDTLTNVMHFARSVGENFYECARSARYHFKSENLEGELSVPGNPFGMRCPKCGNSHQLRIHADVVVALTADGSVDVGDHEWDHDCLCMCCECDHEAPVKEFIKDFQEQQPESDAQEAARMKAYNTLRAIEAAIEATYRHDAEGNRVDGDSPISGADFIDLVLQHEDNVKEAIKAVQEAANEVMDQRDP